LSEKTLKSVGDKVPSELRTEVESAIEQGREALTSDDAARMQAALDRLTTASHKLAEAAYQGASGSGQTGSNAGTSRSQEGVVDAEVVDEGSSRS
jgi:molecular chaperone DnaK